MLAFLHGFLGSPRDWEELISLLPEFECKVLSYPFRIPSEAIAVGYSLGGRIALSHKGPKIILSAHPGLASQEERARRKEEEDFWISCLKNLSLKKFLEKWYAQPLFDTLRKHPMFPLIQKRREHQKRETLLAQLREHRLSEQPLFQPKEDAFFLYGENDAKYLSLLSSYPHSYKIEKSGHACHLENPQKCAEVIRCLIRMTTLFSYEDTSFRARPY